MSSARTLAERANKAKSNAETLRQKYALQKELKKTLGANKTAGAFATAVAMAKHEAKSGVNDFETALDAAVA